MIVVALLGAALAALSMWEGAPMAERWAGPAVLRVALLAISALAVLYVLHRTIALRRLASRLEDEQVLSTAYSNRVRDLSSLVATAQTINGVLELDQALRTLLDESLKFFQAPAGSIMLVDDEGFLETACSRGNERAVDARVKIGHSIAGHVALTREPLLLEGQPSAARFPHLVEREEPVASAMSVPLIHRDEVLGVLNVTGDRERAFTDHDLQLAKVFAGHVSVAITNARTFASERERLSQLADLNRTKSDLIGAISHDLRGPVAALSGSLQALRGMDPRDEAAQEALVSMERQVERLSASLDRLLAEPAAGQDASPPGASIADLAEVARTVAGDFGAAGREVATEVPEACLVSGDPDLLQQVLWILVENAFQHGAPPVRIEVRTVETDGVVSVIDAGPGITPDDRERIARLAAGSVGVRVGLGLSIAHAIVSGTGGRLWAEDADTGGAVFHVAIPQPQGAPEPRELRGAPA